MWVVSDFGNLCGQVLEVRVNYDFEFAAPIISNLLGGRAHHDTGTGTDGERTLRPLPIVGRATRVAIGGGPLDGGSSPPDASAFNRP